MTDAHINKLQKIFRRRFDDIMAARMGVKEDGALQAGFDEWGRWLERNKIKVRLFDTTHRHDPKKFVRIYDATGFRFLYVPLELAEKALLLGGLP